MRKLCGTILAALLPVAVCAATYKVDIDRSDGLYRCGETATFFYVPAITDTMGYLAGRQSGHSGVPMVFIAWSSFENGMNGFAYYCYYAPRGNPWDIRTWGSLDYRYKMVFPLENDVAVTPIYETMREAWEDYRLLTALRNAGKEAVLGELLSEFESATNYADIENVPNRASFSKLRERALGAFDGQAGK